MRVRGEVLSVLSSHRADSKDILVQLRKRAWQAFPVTVIHIGLRPPLRQKEKTNMSGGTIFLTVYTFCENFFMKLVALYFFICSHRIKHFSKENRRGGCFQLLWPHQTEEQTEPPSHMAPLPSGTQFHMVKCQIRF